MQITSFAARATKPVPQSKAKRLAKRAKAREVAAAQGENTPAKVLPPAPQITIFFWLDLTRQGYRIFSNAIRDDRDRPRPIHPQDFKRLFGAGFKVPTQPNALRLTLSINEYLALATR